MLTVVVAAASVSASRRPSFLSDVSHRAVGRGFLPADGFKVGFGFDLTRR